MIHSHASRAFTLLEMLLAMSLSVFLLSALVGLMSVSDSSMTNQDADESTRQTIQQWQRPFLDLLRSDLQGASRWYADENILILLADLSVADHESTVRSEPSFVHYGLRTIGDKTWFIRSVHHFVQETIQSSVSELITSDIEQFELFETPHTNEALEFTRAEPEKTDRIPIADPFFDLERLARAMHPTPSSVELHFQLPNHPNSEWSKSLLIH